MVSVAMETQTKLTKILFFKIFNVLSAIFGAFNYNFDIAPHEDQHQTSVTSKTGEEIMIYVKFRVGPWVVRYKSGYHGNSGCMIGILNMFSCTAACFLSIRRKTFLCNKGL